MSSELEKISSFDQPVGPTTEGIGRLLATLPFAIMGFTLFWGAVQFIMVPLQVQTIAPEGRDSALAWVVGAGAVASMLTAPVAGALTDRTRTRIGGREPWLIGASVITVALSVVAANASSIIALAVLIAALQVSTNFILTPVSAYIPDRVPVARRGAFSAAYGAAQLVGALIGQVAGSQLGEAVRTGYLAAALILASLVVTFALANMRSNLHRPRRPVAPGSWARTFWVNPVHHPNFALAFVGRFLLFTGAFPVQTYLLFILQDYIGLGGNALDAIPILGLADLLGVLVGTLLAGYLVHRTGRTRPFIYLAAALLAVGLAVPLAWPTYEAMLVCSVLSGLGLGLFLAVDLVLITLVLPSAHDNGKDLGIINVTTTLPQTLGAAVGSTLIAAFGSYAALLVFAIVCTVLGAGVLAFIRGIR